MAYAFRTHYQSLVFCVVYYRSWFFRLSFVFSFPLSFTASDFLFDIFIFFVEYILHINLRGNDTYHVFVISDKCCRPYSYRHVETSYRIISFVDIICFQSDCYHAYHVLYSYEVEFKQGHVENNLNNLSLSLKFMFPN